MSCIVAIITNIIYIALASRVYAIACLCCFPSSSYAAAVVVRPYEILNHIHTCTSLLSLSSTRHDPRTHIHSAYTYTYYTRECWRARIHCQKACPLSQKPSAHRIYAQPQCTHTHTHIQWAVPAAAQCTRALSSASDNTSVRMACMRCRFNGPATRPSAMVATEQHTNIVYISIAQMHIHTVDPDLQKHTHSHIFYAHIRMLLLLQLHIAPKYMCECWCSYIRRIKLNGDIATVYYGIYIHILFLISSNECTRNQNRATNYTHFRLNSLADQQRSACERVCVWLWVIV